MPQLRRRRRRRRPQQPASTPSALLLPRWRCHCRSVKIAADLKKASGLKLKDFRCALWGADDGCVALPGRQAGAPCRSLQLFAVWQLSDSCAFALQPSTCSSTYPPTHPPHPTHAHRELLEKEEPAALATLRKEVEDFAKQVCGWVGCVCVGGGGGGGALMMN